MVVTSRETKQVQRALRAADASSVVAIVATCAGALTGAFSSGVLRIAAWCFAGAALTMTFLRQNGAAEREEQRLRSLPFLFPVDSYLAILGSTKTRHTLTLHVSMAGGEEAATSLRKQLGSVQGATRLAKGQVVIESPSFDTRRTPMNDETPEVEHETSELHKWTRGVLLTKLAPLHRSLAIDNVSIKSVDR